MQPDTRHTTAPNVLTWRRGAVEGHWSANLNGNTYDLWKGLDGYWRLRVNGLNYMAPDSTTAWGVKATAQDVADRHARSAPRRRTSGRS